MTFNRNLFIHAYEILDGVPEAMINLTSIANAVREAPGCKTIACGAGWLAMHPDFKALGLQLCAMTHSIPGLSFDGRAYEPNQYGSVMAKVFDMPKVYADKIFAPRGRHLGDASLTDKQELLRRMREYLAERDAEVTPA